MMAMITQKIFVAQSCWGSHPEIAIMQNTMAGEAPKYFHSLSKKARNRAVKQARIQIDVAAMKNKNNQFSGASRGTTDRSPSPLYAAANKHAIIETNIRLRKKLKSKSTLYGVSFLTFTAR